ncbi:hypothetical protein RND81_03G049100 [Saponaria officinalis]|uniref:Uncharacterized protein n=1 Tax=Saponaria officinalis TaxID=3572 RepID=A0AAW1M3D8_SAPOF
MELNALNKQLVPFDEMFPNFGSGTLHITEDEAEKVPDVYDELLHVNDVHEISEHIVTPIDSNPTTTTIETDSQVSPNVIGIPGDGVPQCPEHLKPSTGKTFATLEEGLSFYKEYAKNFGFTARLDSSKSH